MIIPDVNLALLSHNVRDPVHGEAAAYWNGLLTGEEMVGFTTVVLMGFVRISSGPHAFAAPLSGAQAAGIAGRWLNRPNAVLIEPGPRHFEVLADLLSRVASPSKLSTDAHLAALAIERGAMLHSRDGDFRLWPELRHANPLTA